MMRDCQCFCFLGMLTFSEFKKLMVEIYKNLVLSTELIM